MKNQQTPNVNNLVRFLRKKAVIKITAKIPALITIFIAYVPCDKLRFVGKTNKIIYLINPEGNIVKLEDDDLTPLPT